MRKFFDSRRELVSSGPGSGGGGSSSGSSHAGGNFIGRGFTVGRHQVTVEEIIAEGERWRPKPNANLVFIILNFSPPNAGFYFEMYVLNSYMSSNDKSSSNLSFTASSRFPISNNLVLQANLSTNKSADPCSNAFIV